MDVNSGATGADDSSKTEQQVQTGIDFAAQCAKMFGFGKQASALAPLAMVGVHLGFAIAHLFMHHAQQQPTGKPLPQPDVPAAPSQSGQPL